MAYLLKDLVLDAGKLPANWSDFPEKIAAEKLNIPAKLIRSAQILSASVDSRRGQPKLLPVMLVDAPGLPETSPDELAAFMPPEPEFPQKSTLKHPVVVGTGPAGIFAALCFAQAGAEPIIIDRGEPVEKRVVSYQEFLRTRQLDTESNLLIGEGGAGTFSDGKLYTGTKDFRAAWVKKVLVSCGAPPEILWQKRPHAGSDHLAVTAANLRKKIESLGGRFIFDTEVVSLHTVNGRCAGVRTAGGEIIEAPAVLLAPGLGGRYLVRSLLKQVDWELKPFQTGCRIEHPQNLIDKAMYHVPRPAALGAAEYHIVSRNYPRHTASFCMCPGGEVVNATAWEKRSISNGMSCFDRDTEFANSCLICTFQPDEFASAAEIDTFFEQTESRCFAAGGGDYTLPAQDAAAFMRHEPGLKNSRTTASVGICSGRIDQIVTAELHRAFSAALKDFDRRMPGFIRYGKFVGVESCVSSPVRIIRDREMLTTSLPGLYCAGEGCGLAGGIISAACDGIRTALCMIS